MKSGRPFFFLEIVFSLVLGLLIVAWGRRYDIETGLLIPFFLGFAFHLTAMLIYLQPEWKQMDFTLFPGRLLAVFLMSLWFFTREESFTDNVVNDGLDSLLIAGYTLFQFLSLLVNFPKSKKLPESGVL